ncbi:ubiquitin carboxyl-terminal hydrolase MINDY-2 [Sorex fumeus]|uniref:ubiquitin carboxyl-terminal hydrolase MINDY-2 n=1 Tax=Sorex fumeus TaxID=62283 RepID=UPI0024ADDFFD|nr:ubiquitin carboxyl-terminal hydrolase MINDY-2 [Sorex fumeus]
MESGPGRPRSPELGAAPRAESAREGRPESPRAGGEGAGAGGPGRGAAAAGAGGLAPPVAGPASPPAPGASSPGPDSRARGVDAAAAQEAAPRGQRKVTASPAPAAAAAAGEGPAGPCRLDPAVPGPEPGGGGDDSESSPPGASPSLDSLGSFSHLPSSPSSPEAEAAGEEGAEGGGPGPAGPGPGARRGGEALGRERGPGQSVYHIKWIQWKEENTPIITQNENGPCPLLAILNVLLLAWKVKLPPMMEIITAEQLMEYLGDYMLEAKPKEISEIQRLNYEQNMSDAMAILHKLQTGLDVNVKFTGVRVFEYTPECIVFDLLDIPLYHGWLVDPQTDDIVKAVGNCSYNQLVEKIISCKQSDSSELVSEGFVAEQFLNNTATQLTYHGLCELTSTVQEGELCVFFRNNHFSTMTKYEGLLYLLVTDQGFLTEEKVVWESLHNVDGDGNFCDSEFHLRPPSDPETVYRGQQDQIDQDYLMALSLQQEQQSQEVSWEQVPEGLSDLELARRLQEEEDRRASQYYQEQEQAAATATAAPQAQSQPAQASPSSARQPGSSERKRKEPREKEKEKEREKNSCVIL